jgi:hypothetical protein
MLSSNTTITNHAEAMFVQTDLCISAGRGASGRPGKALYKAGIPGKLGKNNSIYA